MNKVWIKIVFSLILLTAWYGLANAQIKDTTGKEDVYLLQSVVLNGDTIGSAQIQEVVIFPKVEFDSRRQYRRFQKMIKDLKKVYPYAQKAKYKLIEMNEEYKKLETEKQKRIYINHVEKELKDEFKDDIKKLTITQGRYLLKLIDRETGNTSYELLKEIKGSFSAVFWQTIARVFGHDLRAEYDPYGRDRLMERIVILIEHNQI